ncbi:SCP2 sterol-binding domain-containing protein [Pseudaestuariivita sp.]|uniref:SCP2 sterol-binding domain-containing protein n=1 Tax=Pseudaestuariivita sp. TaxID=2211669 RepID=UPI004059AE80
MSDTMDQAVSVLSEKFAGADIGGTVKFDIEGEGAIMVDDAGVRRGDEEADVTLKADADTFQEILEGSLNPTSAFMGGRLTVDGDMGLAMKLASVLA